MAANKSVRAIYCVHFQKPQQQSMPPPRQSETEQALLRQAREILEGGGGREQSALVSSSLSLRLCISNVPVAAGTRETLLPHSAAMQVAEKVNAQFTHEPINATEGKPACHPVLRSARAEDLGEALQSGCGQAISERRRMFELAEEIGSCSSRTVSGGAVQTVIHLGTGGSHWPAKLLYESFEGQSNRIECEFVASDDPSALEAALKRNRPETTVVVVSSKSFRTPETLNNAKAAREWLKSCPGDKASSSMIAVTAQPEEAVRFGIGEERVLRLPDWVGGRFSAWSAASVSAVIAHGRKWFEEVLAGGREMDAHVRTEAPESNLSLQLAMYRVWLHDFLGYPTRCLIPYSHGLRSFIELHQQQLMESCGKRPLAAQGERRPSCEIVWGGEGPVCEHTFFQHLLQSGMIVPVEMIAFADGAGEGSDLLAHCLGQRQALRDGLSPGQAEDFLLGKGMGEEQAKQLAPNLAAAGNQPTITVLMDKRSPRSIGRLLALYEHSVIAQAAFRGVNPYDQWGVELGKERTVRMRSAIERARKSKGEPLTGADIDELPERESE